MTKYLDSITGPDASAPVLSPKEQEKSIAAMFMDAALGLAMGPKQLVENTKDAIQDFNKPDALAAERPYVKVGYNPAQQNAAQIGSLFTSMGTGAMIGSTLGPIGAAIGGTVGAFYGAFVANPTDGNIVDAAKALGVPVFDAMNKYSHSPTDTAMDARLKNLAADGWLEAITMGAATVGGKMLKSRRTVEAGKKAIKVLKDEFDTARTAVAPAATEVTEAEGKAALKASKRKTATPGVEPKVKEAASNPEAPAPATVAAQEESAQFEQFAKDKIAERRQDLEKVTGRQVTDNEVLETFEAEYGQKNPPKKPEEVQGVKEFTEDFIETAPDEVLTATNKHIDDVLPDAESPRYNTNAKEDTRAAVEESAWNIYSETRRLFKPGTADFEAVYGAANRIAKDPEKIKAVIQKTTKGEALTLEESAATLIHSYDNTMSPENAELLAKVMAGEATDAEVAAFQEGMNDIVSAYVAPIMLDAVEANTNSLKMGIRRYVKEYHNAGVAEVSGVPNMKAKMAAVNTYIEARGGAPIAAEDAGEFVKWLTEAAISKEVPTSTPTSISKVLPRDLPALVEHAKKVMAATSQEMLADAVPKMAARSWGGKLADGIVSYRIKNMLNHWWTPVTSAVGGLGDAGMRTTVNYLKLPYVGAADMFNKVMRRDTPDLFMSNLKRANAYAESLFKGFKSAGSLAHEGWKVYDPTATSVQYALDPMEKLAAKGIAADETFDAASSGGGAFSFIKNGFWTVMSMGERSLFAWDRAISTITKEARYASEAAFEGYERGLRGADLDNYIKDPPVEIIAKYKDEAMRDANRFAYRGEPDIPLFKALVDGHGADDMFSGTVRFMNPFLRPALISMELIAEHLPGANMLLPRTREALASGDANRIAEVMARATSGTLPLMGAMQAARSGYISGPSKDGAMFDDDGKRVPPYHLKIGKKWVPIDKIFGQGMVTNFIKMGATLDSMFDYLNEGQYSAAFSLALFGMGESMDFSRFSVFGDLDTDITKAAMGQMTIPQLADKYALRNIPRTFLPGQRIAGDIFAGDVERQRVVSGEGLEFLTNALTQTFRETYTPEKLATRPNYLGEAAGRRSTFFYTFDTYSSGQEGGRSMVPLKVLRDLDAHAKLYEHLGMEQVSKPIWPKIITDSASGIDITLTPPLANAYQDLVSGYREVNGELIKLNNRMAPMGAQLDYRESLEALYTKYSGVISKLYNNEELTSEEINPLIMEINAQKEYRHTEAKKMIMEDPRYKALVEQAKAGQEQLSNIINYGG